MTCLEITRTWNDPTTGREVRQLTNLPDGAQLDYFRYNKHLPDGRLVAFGKHDTGNVLLVDAAAGVIEALPIKAGAYGVSKLQVGTSRLWIFRRKARELWTVDLPGGEPERVLRIPDEVTGGFSDISCDGKTALFVHIEQDLSNTPIPTVDDHETFWKYTQRPRTGVIWAVDTATGEATQALTTDGVGPSHVEAWPSDPTRIRYCLDHFEGLDQRVWTVRTDGSDNRKFRPQEPGELITHEFSWPDGQHVGYTYQDRRNDPTLRTQPLAEYAPIPTQLGIADAEGNEVYLSNPLNSYHTHIYVSPDAKWISGEGTDGNSFVYAAPFSMDDPQIDMQRLAELHTVYTPFRGQMAECNFSADSRWLLFDDTIDGKFQICAVKVAE